MAHLLAHFAETELATIRAIHYTVAGNQPHGVIEHLKCAQDE